MMEQSDLVAAMRAIVHARKSVRGYRSEAVPQAIIESVFELAAWAPSNYNTQPWHAVVLSGAACNALRKAVTDAAAAGHFSFDFPFDGNYTGVFAERQADHVQRLQDAFGIARDDTAARDAILHRNFRFFEAPHVVLFFLPQPFDLREAADVGMYTQTLMLAMAAHGIASCPQTSLGFMAETIRQHLQTPPHLRLLYGMSFGYADAAHAANRVVMGRAPLADLVEFRSAGP